MYEILENISMLKKKITNRTYCMRSKFFNIIYHLYTTLLLFFTHSE